MQKKTKAKLAIKKKRRNFTDIPKTVKMSVWLRDNRNCIYCKGHRDEYREPIVGGVRKMSRAIYMPCPNAHFIPRSKGGLGIEENIVTLCQLCHHDYDHGKDEKISEDIYNFIKDYLSNYYGKDWEIEKLYYKKEMLYK